MTSKAPYTIAQLYDFFGFEYLIYDRSGLIIWKDYAITFNRFLPNKLSAVMATKTQDRNEGFTFHCKGVAIACDVPDDMIAIDKMVHLATYASQSRVNTIPEWMKGWFSDRAEPIFSVVMKNPDYKRIMNYLVPFESDMDRMIYLLQKHFDLVPHRDYRIVFGSLSVGVSTGLISNAYTFPAAVIKHHAVNAYHEPGFQGMYVEFRGKRVCCFSKYQSWFFTAAYYMIIHEVKKTKIRKMNSTERLQRRYAAGAIICGVMALILILSDSMFWAPNIDRHYPVDHSEIVESPDTSIALNEDSQDTVVFNGTVLIKSKDSIFIYQNNNQ